MALHMVDDPGGDNDYDESRDSGRRNTGGTGGGGNLLSFLPMLLGLFGRGGKGGGKGLIWLLIIGGIGYFIFTQTDCGSGVANNLFSKSGYDYDPNEFSKAKVYEGLADDNSKNPLPEAVSLAAFAPQRMDQGKQGSCVAWSSAYAAGSILEAASTRTSGNSKALSPAFLYNNIALDGCQGSYIQKAMEFMQKYGSVPYTDFRYDENDCSRSAGRGLVQEAQNHKIHGFQRLTVSEGVDQISVRAIKEHLAKDAPVVIGMMVGGTFMEGMMGQKLWKPTGNDRQQMGFGGHAMCVIGYDDRLAGGAFQIMNSWGPQWGENGIAFIRYADFTTFVREAYGLDPLPKSEAALNVVFECTVGMINNATKQPIALKAGNGNVFKSINPIAKGTKFKMEMKNATECYIYIFTPDLQGKSTVLFPYKPIHSAYCGITGYRLFPRTESIQADDVGNMETMAVVVSKNELNYAAINDAINKSAGSFAQKVNATLSAQAIKNVNYSSTSTGSIYFRTPATQNGVVVSIVEMEKR